MSRESYFGPSGKGTPAVSHGDTAAIMCWLNLSGAYGGYAGLERARADARLIAAAPDLLAALEALLSVCREELDPARTPEMSAARAAIKKARGE